jgi:hypothetical protein
MSYEIIPQITVNSFGGDSQAYQRFLEFDDAKRYVRVD